MKKCSKGNLCFNPNGGFDTLLFDDEFSKNSQAKNGLRSYCKYCQKQYRDNNKEYKKYWMKEYNSKLDNVLNKRTASSNTIERNRPNKQKSTPHGSGIYKNLEDVIRIRTNGANQTSKKRDKNLINNKQTKALLISQNYLCPITGENIADNYTHLSLDHLIPDAQGGKNVIENIILCYDMFNYAKNGYYLVETLDILLKIANLTDEQRKQRIDEITNKIWDIQQIYPKIYEKISKMSKKEITLLLDSRISIKDLLNT